MQNATKIQKKEDIKMIEKKKLNYLKGKIREKNETYKSLSEKTGISINSLCNRLNGKTTFSIDEMDYLCNVLDISAHEIPKYFFNRMLQNASKSPA